MTCNDQKDACPGDCDECGEYKTLSSKTAISRAIDFSVSILYELDTIFDKDTKLEDLTVAVNAARLASVCDSLLEYAESYDEVNVKEMFEMCSSIQEHSVHNTNKVSTIH